MLYNLETTMTLITMFITFVSGFSVLSYWWFVQALADYEYNIQKAEADGVLPPGIVAPQGDKNYGTAPVPLESSTWYENLNFMQKVGYKLDSWFFNHGEAFMVSERSAIPYIGNGSS